LENSQNIVEVLKEILKWTKFSGMQELKRVLETNLDDTIKKSIYHWSDGSDSKQIASRAKVSDQTVRNYWKKWAAIGIMEPCPKFKGRYWKLFSLEQIGIEMPDTEGELIHEGKETGQASSVETNE
jgi:transposase